MRTERELIEQAGQEVVKEETEKLVAVYLLIQTKARGQFLALACLYLPPKWNQKTKKIHVFTCCKCFPTACMLTLVRPVSCV